jgi:hypothetical protein
MAEGNSIEVRPHGDPLTRLISLLREALGKQAGPHYEYLSFAADALDKFYSMDGTIDGLEGLIVPPGEAAREARPIDACDPGAGPPLMFFFGATGQGGPVAIEGIGEYIRQRLDDGHPMIFVDTPPESVAVLQLVDGRWVPAWPVPMTPDPVPTPTPTPPAVVPPGGGPIW